MKSVIINSDNFIFCVENEGVMTRIKELDEYPTAGWSTGDGIIEWRNPEDALRIFSYCYFAQMM